MARPLHTEAMSIVVAGLVVILTVASLIWWWFAGAGNRHSTVEPSAAELAYLRSDANLALFCGLGWLRAAGAVSVAWRGQMVSVGKAPAGADPLALAIHSALRTPAPWSAMALDPRVTAQLDRIHRRLTIRGWLLPQRQLQRMRSAAAVPAALVIGLSFTIDWERRSWLPAALLLMNVAAGVLMLATSERSHAGRRVLRRHRRLHQESRSGRHSSGASPERVARAVALFGMSRLFAFDMQFARLARLPVTWGGSESYPGTGGATPGI